MLLYGSMLVEFFLEFILGCRNNSLMSQSVIKALEQLLH